MATPADQGASRLDAAPMVPEYAQRTYPLRRRLAGRRGPALYEALANRSEGRARPSEDRAEVLAANPAWTITYGGPYTGTRIWRRFGGDLFEITEDRRSHAQPPFYLRGGDAVEVRKFWLLSGAIAAADAAIRAKAEEGPSA